MDDRYAKIKDIVEREQNFKKEQEDLHQKHDDISEDTIIVEKGVAVRSTLSFIKGFFKAVIGVVFILLAAIGILTLLYPDIRAEFLTVINETVLKVTEMLGVA